MRATVNVLLGLLAWPAAVTAPFWLAFDAAAQDASAPATEERPAAGRWIPSIAVISGVTVQEWSGSLESAICRECTFPDPAEEELRIPRSGSTRDVSPYVGGNVEVMTPELSLPGSPRLFVAGDLVAAFGTLRRVTGEGEPGAVRSPVPAAAQDQTPYDESNALGQGSELAAEIDQLVYGARAGIAFPLELFGHQLRLKPSVGWLRYRVDVQGQVVDAECLQVNPTTTRCNTTPSGMGFQRTVRLPARGDLTLDGVGPGIELEMDTGRVGPLATSIFLGGHVYRLLGDHTLDLQVPTQSYADAAGTDQASAAFHYEIDPWMYRLGVGLRLQWLGSQ